MRNLELLKSAASERERLIAEREHLTAKLDAAINELDQFIKYCPESALNRLATHFGGKQMGSLSLGIERVLEENPQGLRPRHVSALLLERGFKVGGATNFKNRVAAEMGRLLRSNRIQKKDDGAYCLKAG